MGPLEHLPENEEDRSEDNHGVVSDESFSSKVARLECRVAVHEDDHDLEAESDPGAVWLEITAVWQRLAVKTLHLASLVEAEVGDAHDDVVDNTSSGDDVGEVCQNLGGRVGQVQEGQEREDHDDEEAVDRNSVLGALAQELGGTALNGERVQASSGTIGVGVTSRKDTCDQQRVDEIG